jgi:hypothetical protein
MAAKENIWPQPQLRLNVKSGPGGKIRVALARSKRPIGVLQLVLVSDDGSVVRRLDHLAGELLEGLDVRLDLIVAVDEIATVVLVLGQKRVDDGLGDVRYLGRRMVSEEEWRQFILRRDQNVIESKESCV